MLAVTFYDSVVALHVMAIVIAFGAPFAYPLVTPYLQREHPGALPAWHGAQARIGQRIIAPVGGIALLLGAYLASDRDLWSEVWVTVPLVILLIELGVGGAVIAPRERKLSEIARDPSSGEYRALAKTVLTMQTVLVLLVLVAIYFMVTKLGA